MRFRSKPVEIEATQLTEEAIGRALSEGGALPTGVTFRGTIYVEPKPVTRLQRWRASSMLASTRKGTGRPCVTVAPC
jgi:hypothetical protein